MTMLSQDACQFAETAENRHSGSSQQAGEETRYKPLVKFPKFQRTTICMARRCIGHYR